MQQKDEKHLVYDRNTPFSLIGRGVEGVDTGIILSSRQERRIWETLPWSIGIVALSWFTLACWDSGEIIRIAGTIPLVTLILLALQKTRGGFIGAVGVIVGHYTHAKKSIASLLWLLVIELILITLWEEVLEIILKKKRFKTKGDIRTLPSHWTTYEKKEQGELWVWGFIENNSKRRIISSKWRVNIQTPDGRKLLTIEKSEKNPISGFSQRDVELWGVINKKAREWECLEDMDSLRIKIEPLEILFEDQSVWKKG
jgi:hypothetical protein